MNKADRLPTGPACLLGSLVPWAQRQKCPRSHVDPNSQVETLPLADNPGRQSTSHFGDQICNTLPLCQRW